LGVSPGKAHRLIAQAHEQGLVKVFIEGAPNECLELESDLAARYGLDNCVVAPSLTDDPEKNPQADFKAVGAAAARFLHTLIEQSGPLSIGVGKGRSLAAMVDNLPTLKRPDLKFVSVSGSLTRNLAANPFDIVHKLVERTGGEGYFLPVPYIAASVEEKELLLAQRSVQDLLALARKADVFIIGVGAVGGDAHVRQVGMVSEAEWLELKSLGALGDVMGRFIDADGLAVESEVNAHSVGLTVDDLAGRRVIAVVGGAAKGDAVMAALKTGVITDLVLGEAAARHIVKKLRREDIKSEPERVAV
jgi:DNA-binding transcriptional regulator LsrR (DeoR family)